jgi:hypothetical protein
VLLEGFEIAGADEIDAHQPIFFAWAASVSSSILL